MTSLTQRTRPAGRSEVGSLTRSFMKRCGYTDAQLAVMSGDTRLLQDIHLTGDNAWDEFTILHKEFGVDLTGFNVDDYFPAELSNATLVIRLFRWTKYGAALLEKYPEITLNKIERVLQIKRWRCG